MAKVSFNKLNQIKKLSPITYQYGDYEIEVEQYLPLEDKIALIENVIAQSGNGEEGFFNIIKLEAYYRIEMLKAYTNISFTDKQLEDTPKLYDALVLNDIWACIGNTIPESERNYIWENIIELAREITTYNNSVLGILRTVKNGYSDTEFNISQLKDEIEKLRDTYLVKEIVPLLGLE